MKAYQIFLDDWHRILIGNYPAAMYFELLVRAAFVFLLMVVCMRLIGKRMATQLTRLEIAALSSLAATGGAVLLNFQRGLLTALLAALAVVAIQRMLAMYATRNEKINTILQGKVGILIGNGHIHLEQMEKVRLSKERLFAQLRSEGVMHLGMVDRLYFEADGNFTLVQNKQPESGLPILPTTDPLFLAQQVTDHEHAVCSHCGKRYDKAPRQCSICAASTFIAPITQAQKK